MLKIIKLLTPNASGQISDSFGTWKLFW